MLLTSSQVSVAIISGVAVLFTLALFLSGYAVQQRVLRDLRASIRKPPEPSPKIFLPDRFSKSTTELPDGTVVELDSDDDNEDGALSPYPKRPVDDLKRGTEHDVVEVKMSTAKETDSRRAADRRPQTAPPVPAYEPWKEQKPLKDSGEATVDEKTGKPISRAERRKRLRAELKKLSQVNTPFYYEPRVH